MEESLYEQRKNKEERRLKAVKHSESMGSLYATEIENSARNTLVYQSDICTNVTTSFGYETLISVEDMDSCSAVHTYSKEGNKACVLNFASYKNPGGGFIVGSMAQEEALCLGSNLYNILSSERLFNQFYSINRTKLNKGLYGNNLLYSPDVIFIEEGKVTHCDVITCAAPNSGLYLRYNPNLAYKVPQVISDRINHILYSAYDNDVKTLILGAFGCGVFKNNPKEVAELFKLFLNGKYKGCFEKVIFAIPNGVNLNVFKGVFQS